MSKRPGGELATRPLHFIWICDTSGSMSVGGKMNCLNGAIRDSLPYMRQAAEDNPNACVLIRALGFSHGACWHVPHPTKVEEFSWADLVADPLIRPAIDTVFLVDTSGSMGNEIDAVKRSCLSFADRIIEKGADVRLGLVGFDIGGHRRRAGEIKYKVHQLSRYTIGVWPLTSPNHFKGDVQSLSLGLFGGGGCYLANKDTIDIFPHIVRTFNGPPENSRVLVVISDEIGDTSGLIQIIKQLKESAITTHVLGVPKRGGAHQAIAEQTGGKFWDINLSKGSQDFTILLGAVAETIAKESTQKLSDGTTSSGTDMGAALLGVAEQLRIPPMSDRALPPVLVLVSDGRPTDNFKKGLGELLSLPWGKKAVRLAIAIGEDADLNVLQQFIGNAEVAPLQAKNPEALVKYVKWVSTAVLKAASSPVSQAGGVSGTNVPLPAIPQLGLPSSSDVW